MYHLIAQNNINYHVSLVMIMCWLDQSIYIFLITNNIVYKSQYHMHDPMNAQHIHIILPVKNDRQSTQQKLKYM